MKFKQLLITRLICLLSIGLYTNNLFSQSFTKLVDPVFANKPGDWRSATMMDYDNNFTLDIFIGAGAPNANGLIYNSDNSTFLDSSSLVVVSQSSASGQSFWADIDNDCDLDVFWPDALPATNPFFLNNGTAGFSQLSNVITNSSINSVSATWLDYNKDGNIDLFVPAWTGTLNYLYRNDGNLSFTRIDTGEIATSVGATWVSIAADYDNDGDPDIFMANADANGKNFLLKNHGGAVFRNDTSSIVTKEGGKCNTASWGDFNNDGWIDLFVGRDQLSNLLYKNNGDGTFTKITTGPLASSTAKAGGSVWADFDNDGYLDIYLSTPGNVPNNNIIYMNNGNETFSAVTSGAVYSESYATEGCNAADINNDGFLDIINANRFSSPISIFLNNGNSNNFIKILLTGNTSNRAAIGTKMEIITSSGKQMRYLGAGSGRRSQEPFEIHFGLGHDTIIDTLKIFWPSNNVCTLTDVSVNAFYNIGELTCSLDSMITASFNDSSSFLTAHFNNLSDGAISSYQWDFGDGTSSTQTNPIHRYTQAGKYQVKLTVFDNFCKKTILKDSIEICPDTARLGFASFGIGQNQTFTDTSVSNGYDFQWDFGDGNSANGVNVNHRYSQGGVYTTCLYVTDSCRIDSICQTITVCNDTLEANFGQVNTAYSVSFSDSSINAHSMLWDFGDGNQDSTSINPAHTYTMPGYYTVCMVVEDDCSSDTLCKTIGICLDTAVANFSFVDNINTVSFTSTAQHASTHSWDFGDGNTSSSINPTYTYQQPGTYTVCLTVTNDCYTDTLCQTVSVCLNTTKASFNYSDTLTTVSFNSTSSNATSYLWDFGDGSFSTLQNPTYTYQQYGTYTICLVTSNNCGSDTTCKTINVCPKVAVADYSSHHLGGLNMKFYQLCTNAVSYMWDFGDGNYSASANPSYAFNSAWFFTVCLTATDSCGKTDTYCEEIDLHEFSINELALLELIKVYPNPASDYVYIELPEELTQNASVTISDLQGKVLATQPLENTATSKIDINQYASGIYIINLQLNGASKQVKVRKE